MPIEIRLPRLGWSMEEGTLVQWLKRSGDWVQAGEPLFTIENDKASQDVEAIDSGRLFLPANAPVEGQVIAVGVVLGYLLSESESALQDFTSPVLAEALSVPKSSNDPVVTKAHDSAINLVAGMDSMQTAGQTAAASRPASPRARRLAEELGIELEGIAATGKAGRIAARDVQAAHQQRQSVAGESSTAPGHEGSTGIRRAIAQHLLNSQQQTAAVTITRTLDVEPLVAARSAWKAAAGRIVPSYTDIFVKLCAAALLEHPLLASRWDNGWIVAAHKMHIGIAVDTDHGLVVPVIRDADSLSLEAIAQRSKELIAAARERRLRGDDMRGGVFSITNLGGLGIETFTPIINLPESSILGMGAIAQQPVVQSDGSLGIGWRMTVSLTFDHRLIDGAPAARFLQSLARQVERFA